MKYIRVNYTKRLHNDPDNPNKIVAETRVFHNKWTSWFSIWKLMRDPDISYFSYSEVDERLI